MTTPSFTRRTAIVDAHAHLYDGGANRYGIFARKDPGFEAFVGDYSALPRTYLLDDYLRATSSRKVDGLIWHEFISEDPIKEVTWAQQLAAASEVPIALVGLVDFRDMSLSGYDPGCVKTHTSAKCEKWNSPMLHRALCTQQDLTLATRNSSEIFYARGRCLSFHTAKTRSRLRKHSRDLPDRPIEAWYHPSIA